jgi:hypothetical protein
VQQPGRRENLLGIKRQMSGSTAVEDLAHAP